MILWLATNICYYCYYYYYCLFPLPSVLWYCWLGIRKSIWPVKIWVMRCWHGYLSGARCKWFAYDLAHTTCLIKSEIGLTFLVPSYPGFLAKMPLNPGCVGKLNGCLLCLLPDPNALVAVTKDNLGNKTLPQQNPAVLNWGYWLTLVILYNGHKKYY